MKKIIWLIMLGILLLNIGCNQDDESSGNAVVPQPTSNSCGSANNEFCAYSADSKYAKLLLSCPFGSCDLNTLPFIGQVNDKPTIENIADRLLVTHRWMGKRFIEVLSIAPKDLLTLMKPLTAIVIGSKIRPSYYSSATSAIYLDPAYLWLGNNEKNTIDKEEDYRSDYGDDLQFDFLWRYTLNNEYAYIHLPLDGDETRAINDIKYALIRLLYHELGHANDFMPPDLLSDISLEQTPYQANVSVKNSRLSTRSSYPNNSDILLSLAKISFGGKTPTDSQKKYQPEFLGGEFNTDRGTHYYSFYTQFEDLSMLFEMVMMNYHFSLEADVGFTNNPPKGSTVYEYFVKWGQRNRIYDKQIQLKTQELINLILPDNTWSQEYFEKNRNKSPTPLLIDRNWIENLNPAQLPTIRSENTTPKYNTKISRYIIEQDKQPLH